MVLKVIGEINMKSLIWHLGIDRRLSTLENSHLEAEKSPRLFQKGKSSPSPNLPDFDWLQHVNVQFGGTKQMNLKLKK